MAFLKKPEVRISLSFLVISILWIVFSDKFFLAVFQNLNAVELTRMQTIKGSFFVIGVSCLIYTMIKSSNKRLIQSQEEYKDLFFNTPNPTFVLNLKTNRFCNINKAALDTYGYSTKEFSEMSIEDIRKGSLDTDQPLNNNTGNIFIHKTKNNNQITCIELSRKISIKNSPALLVSVNDITELEHAKLELVQRENQLNQILNSITDGFFILSRDMVVEKANDLFKTIANPTDGNIEGLKLTEILPEFIERASYKQYCHVLEFRSVVHFEINYEKLNKWFQISAYPFDSGLSVFFRDITQEKEDEIQRHQNQQNLLALIHNTEDLMWCVDCNFKYFIFNESYKQHYKRAFGEEVVVGKSALNGIQETEPPDKWKGLYEKALNGEKFTVEMDFVVLENSYFTTIRFNPIYDANENIIGVGCFLQDITERKLHLRKIEQQNKQLKQIAFITSHKVRVPLANILGLAEILDKDNPLSLSNCMVIEHIKTSAKELDASIINMAQQTVDAND